MLSLLAEDNGLFSGFSLIVVIILVIAVAFWLLNRRN